METETERLVQNDQGSGGTVPTPETAVTIDVNNTAAGETFVGETQRPTPPVEEEYSHLPPELRPDANGKFPELTPRLLKQLRAKYYTVRHPYLAECGHKLDMINQPKNNCENCWFQFFNTHPQLVETADQFFRTLGKNAMEGMRGRKFVTNFLRYMATVIHLMKQEGRLPNGSNQSGTDADSVNGGGQEVGEGGSSSEADVQRGEVEASVVSSDETQQ